MKANTQNTITMVMTLLRSLRREECLKIIKAGLTALKKKFWSSSANSRMLKESRTTLNCKTCNQDQQLCRLTQTSRTMMTI